MWQEIRAGEFPDHACLHAICPTAFDPLQAPEGKHAASVYVPVPFQLKGKRPEDWVKLKNGFMDVVFKAWRRYATNLTDENITMKVAMEPILHVRALAQHAARFGLGGAQDATQMGEQRPIEQIADYRTPIQGLYQVGVGDASRRRGDRRLGIQLLAGYERGFETSVSDDRL